MRLGLLGRTELKGLEFLSDGSGQGPHEPEGRRTAVPLRDQKVSILQVYSVSSCLVKTFPAVDCGLWIFFFFFLNLIIKNFPY